MERLALASKALYDREVLEARRELATLKKAVARDLFYSQIEKNLRLLNGHVLRCNCGVCLGRTCLNYPTDMDMTMADADDVWGLSESKDGDVFLDAVRKAREDGTHSRIRWSYALFRTRVGRGGETSRETVASCDPSAECKLLDYFARECFRCGLPSPYELNDASLGPYCQSGCLWRWMGHDYSKTPREGTWAQAVADMSYSSQVTKVYDGLLKNIGIRLYEATDGKVTPTFLNERNTATCSKHDRSLPLDSWFTAYDNISLALD